MSMILMILSQENLKAKDLNNVKFVAKSRTIIIYGLYAAFAAITVAQIAMMKMILNLCAPIVNRYFY
jgi:hypothetical protein